jgi:hypothetical protein
LAWAAGIRHLQVQIHRPAAFFFAWHIAENKLISCRQHRAVLKKQTHFPQFSRIVLTTPEE